MPSTLSPARAGSTSRLDAPEGAGGNVRGGLGARQRAAEQQVGPIDDAGEALGAAARNFLSPLRGEAGGRHRPSRVYLRHRGRVTNDQELHEWVDYTSSSHEALPDALPEPRHSIRCASS